MLEQDDQSKNVDLTKEDKDLIAKIFADMDLSKFTMPAMDKCAESKTQTTLPFLGFLTKRLEPAQIQMTEIDKPDAKFPDAWPHPPQTLLDGKCGITGVCNMLRFYGIEKPPKEIDTPHFRSVGAGMQPETFADDLTELTGKKFVAKQITDGKDPLEVLRGYLKEGKPVAIEYLTDKIPQPPTKEQYRSDLPNAHWVVVTGITEGKNGPELTVQSWGKYYKIPFADIKDQWKGAWWGTGPGSYPYVVGTEASPILKK